MTPRQQERTDTFIATLLGTDQLSAAERARADAQERAHRKSEAKGRRYDAWMKAEAAYGLAYSASYVACHGRVTNQPDRDLRDKAEQAASLNLIEAVAELMACPLVNADDAKERRTMLKRFGRAAGGTITTAAVWLPKRKAWEAALDSATMTEGR